MKEKKVLNPVYSPRLIITRNTSTRWTVCVLLMCIITANQTVVGEYINELSLEFINATTPLQSAANQRVIRSHAARQSHHRRWLQQYGITDSRSSEGERQAALRQRDVSHSPCQCPVTKRPPVAVNHGTDLVASLNYNLAGLTRLNPLPSIPGDTGVQNIAPPPSLPARYNSSADCHQLVAPLTAADASNVALVLPNSDWNCFSLLREQCVCLQCGQQFPLPGFRHQRSRPEHTSNPVSPLGTGHIEPFASLPIEIQPHMWLLIDHCK